MHSEDFPLNLKDYSDVQLYLATNLRKITSSKHLIKLLKEYLEEKDDTKRRLLAAEIILGVED